MCLIPAPFNQFRDLEGIFTGMLRLACVILLIINRKARTKPLCLWILLTLLGIFSALFYLISYINRCRIRLVNVKVLRHSNFIISIKCMLMGGIRGGVLHPKIAFLNRVFWVN